MRTEHIREFVMLATVLSYSQAAEKLYVSESALSRHVAAIEEELGQPLLVRDTHSVRLTAAGEVALDGFKQALERYDSCVHEIERLKEGQQGSLVVATAYFMTSKYLTPLIRVFQETYPEVAVDFLNTTPYEAVSEALDRKCDLALCASYCDDLSDIPEQLGSIVLGRERFALLMSANNPLAAHETVSLRDVDDREIHWVDDPQFLGRLEVLLRKARVVPKSIVKESHPEGIFYSLAEGQGVSFFGESFAADGLVSKQLDEKLYSSAVLCYHKQNANPTLRLFLDSLPGRDMGGGALRVPGLDSGTPSR